MLNDMITHRTSVSERVFETARNECDALRNLAWHCVLVLDSHYLTHRKYPDEVGASVRPPVLLNEPRIREHLQALSEALQLINLGSSDRFTAPKEANEFEAFLRVFRGMMADLLKRSDERSIGIRRQVRGALETALLKWPTAFCWYAHEVFEAASEQSSLLSNLAIATTYARCADEFTAVRSAHEWAVDLLRRKWTTSGASPWSSSSSSSSSCSSSASGSCSSSRPSSSSTTVPSRSVCLTRQQREILEQCVHLAEIFFSPERLKLSVTPRLAPLLLARTGAGKTHLVRELARRLNVDLIRTQRAAWTPIGASKGRSTVFQICDLLARQPARRVLLAIDEIDKMRVEGGAAAPTSDWGGGIFGEVFDVLGGDLSVDAYCAEPGVKITATELRCRARSNLFVMGCGTFQTVFDQAARPSVGFLGAAKPSVKFGDIVAAGIVSRELLARFHSPPFFLPNPEPDEVRELFRQNGIAELAAEVGYEFTAGDYDLSEAGFRGVESLATRLLMRRSAQKRNAIAPPAADARDAAGAPLSLP
jgi:hypothetical protein